MDGRLVKLSAAGGIGPQPNVNIERSLDLRLFNRSPLPIFFTLPSFQKQGMQRAAKVLYLSIIFIRHGHHHHHHQVTWKHKKRKCIDAGLNLLPKNYFACKSSSS